MRNKKNEWYVPEICCNLFPVWAAAAEGNIVNIRSAMD